MSENNPFSLFIDLINFDQELHAQQLNIKKHEQEVSQLEKQKEQLEVELHAAQRVLHNAKKQVDEKELEMKELEASEADKKRRMDTVSSHKEYQSLKHEIEIISSRQLALEDVLVAAWNQLEIAQATFKTQEQVHQEKVQNTESRIAKIKIEIERLNQDLVEKQKARSAKETLVPEEWLEKYRNMSSRVADPVVPVVDGSCTSCFHQLTGQDLIMINRRKLLQCRGCYRFLYSESMSRRTQ